MSFTSAIHDPLTINLRRQSRVLLSKIPSQSPHSIALLNAPYDALLPTLSRLLAVPALTLPIALAFRPILLDLCARWLHDEENIEDRLVALSFLLQPHEELFPVLSAFLRKPVLVDGPLAALLSKYPSLSTIEASRLHRLLLAYYRILQANRELPYNSLWPLSALSQLFWTPHSDAGVRLLAIRCYALQSGMGEVEREKLETEILGEICGVDCPIDYGQEIDGSMIKIDGWIMPIIEAKRVTDARNAIVLEQQDYYGLEDGDTCQPIHPSELSPLIANIHGILLLRSSSSPEITPPLISTATVIQSLRALAIQVSLSLPTLLTSSPSSGKSLLISHLASTLHPGVKSQIITIQLADNSLDPRSLLGSYISSPIQPGTFDWKEGILVRAMKEGKWVVFKDIDRGSSEVLGVIKPLVDSLRMGKWIGGRAALDVPGRGRVDANSTFALFATRSLIPSRSGKFAHPTFFGAHKFHEIIVPSPSLDETRIIIDNRFPQLAGNAAQALIDLWKSVRALGSAASTRDVGLRELEKFCVRIENLLPASHRSMELVSDSETPVSLTAMFPNPSLREDMYLEARDVFFGAGTLTASARAHMEAVALIIAEHLGLEEDRREWVLRGRAPEFEVEKDVNGRPIAVRLGRTRLLARSTKLEITPPVTKPFAMHRPAILLLSRIATALFLSEPVLLTGETGTGKTTIVTHLASLLRRPLISLNLSHQTESSDLVGGFRPVDARVPGSALQEKFLDLFGGTFSRRKNAKFEESVRKAVSEGKWKRAVGLWKESVRLAKDRIQAKKDEELLDNATGDLNAESPRKRRKVDQAILDVSAASWNAFEQSVDEFEVQHIQGKGKFAFGFVEGPLVKALRSGDWVLLDEINLASPETLECISGLLHGPTTSITLTEQGSLEPVPRHPGFRLFACMNPATDVGKKDLPPNIRSRFTEIDVPSPDADRETLLAIITQYIGPNAVGDKAAIMNVAEFYSAVKTLAEERQIVDGSNHRPHYSMRTLARALTFAADMASVYSLRRSIWDGCLMAFTMVLDTSSAQIVRNLAQKHLLAGVRNPRSLLSKEPSVPHSRSPEEFVKLGPFYLEKGFLPEDPVADYIITPSVETKLVDLARIMATRRFPVLIEGPTSSGKTSSVEYLARRTGHRFIRINNHEHTDIQEYLGSYMSDPLTGRLVFRDGLLVRALRNGDWIVLDELNLAPTDVLEALNRLLDDNRELVIPETQEVVRPHPHFMLFATQNPPGLYAGRKVLSRAFRNRFLEVHFEDVPQAELESILCQRCRIAPSYGQRIVSVFLELQKRRQAGRVFESKHGFATLRDLFRWAGRDAIGYQQLAENGYMLLAERARREDDKIAVKEVIESVMKVRIDEKTLYSLQNPVVDIPSFLGCSVPSSSQLVWTSAMQRLFILVTRALRFNEPVLLVGETGSGKTSICQVYADAVSKNLHGLNCHQNTETADLIGGLRPIRNRSAMEAEVLRDVSIALDQIGITDVILKPDTLLSSVDRSLKSTTSLTAPARSVLEDARRKLLRLKSIFEWHDGPLIEAMRSGDVFLLDEISLADDSVLERLNSVLEPARTIVLAERGGDDLEHPAIQAVDGFKLVATMNPGGDYGKKELSPALRNRFTEIWVPPVNDRGDLELIVGSLWKYELFRPYTVPLLSFVEWLCARVTDRSLLSLRDILAWVTFSNSVYRPEREENMPPNEIFHHAAHMTYLDGFGSLPQLVTYSPDALRRLKAESLSKLLELVPLDTNDASFAYVPSHDPSKFTQLGSFAIPKGKNGPVRHGFNLQAPTTRDNAMRVVRACQVPKPILLEGSPGVGKTSLVTALANISGHELCRINLSDQTDLIDLFGSDLPVECGGPGEFAWKDAEFLKALQEGHWVLLDEMNLAPQAVLEGLNAVLDHRGTVYIPELGRSFTRHQDFRIFAAQNPLHQGGGRKGLPKSFVNRFTKVYVDELSSNDLVLVCRHLFPDQVVDILRAMVTYNAYLTEEIGAERMFAIEGSPWEFNLRDVIRWGTLLNGGGSPLHPAEYLRTVYLHRFRTLADRNRANSLFGKVFSMSTRHPEHAPPLSMSSSYLQIGHFLMQRKNFALLARPGRILQTQLSALESVGHCVAQSWLAIVIGVHGTGKSDLIKVLANCTGNPLCEIPINSATDTMDILGSFEQVDNRCRVFAMIQDIISLFDRHLRSTSGSKFPQINNYNLLRKALRECPTLVSLSTVLQVASNLLDDLRNLEGDLAVQCQSLQAKIQDSLPLRDMTGRFEWVDGPLVRAMKLGHWVLMDGANLCNPSVLDRLNSLCEPDGVLVLSERGYVGGRVQIVKPHTNFRLFMSVDPQYGELSRAMRNRGIEIALVPDSNLEDQKRLQDYMRLPLAVSREADLHMLSVEFEGARRGILSQHQGVLHPSDVWPPGHALDQDCALSTVLDQIPHVVPSPCADRINGLLYFFAHIASPTYLPHFSRIFTTLTTKMNPQFAQLHTLLRIILTCANFPLITKLRDGYSKARGVPLNFTFTKPMDFYLSCTQCFDCNLELEEYSAHRVILQILNLCVALFIDQQESQSSKTDSISDAVMGRGSVHENANSTGRAMKEVELVLDAIPAACHAALASVDSVSKFADLELALKLLKYTRHLRRAISSTFFDYSAVQAISRWIADALQECSPIFIHLLSRARTLEDAVCLSSGLGLTEIWSSFLVNRPLHLFSIELTHLDAAARNLKENVYGLRRQAFELLAMRTLPTKSTDQESMALLTLNQEVENRLLHNRQEPPRADHQIENASLIAELRVLGGNITEATIQVVDKIIELACLDPQVSLLRLVSYQHVAWSVNAGRATLPMIVQSQMQWLKAIWAVRPSAGVADGPSMLLHPSHLHATVLTCDWSRSPLLSLKDYEATILRHIEFSYLQCEGDVSRTQQIAAFLQQCIFTISICFSPSFDEDTWQNIRNVCCNLQLGISVSLGQLIVLLERTNNVPFGQALGRFLRPALQGFLECQHSRRESIFHMGLSWVALSRLIIHLYVPDAPIDPAAIQHCTLELWRQEEEIISEQIRLHSQFEQASTGNDSNVILSYLRARLHEVSEQMAKALALPLHDRHDVSRLHMFWSEVLQFQNQVISHSRIDSLLLLFESGDESAPLREQVLQQSMTGFCQRLDVVYPEYNDVSTPLQLALSYMKLGLRLIASVNCDSSSSVGRICTALVTFPSVQSSSLLRTEPEMHGLPGVTVFGHLLLNLASVGFDRSLGVDIEANISAIETTYGQVLRLWLIDRAREDEQDQVSQTLYRRKPLDYDAVGDAEAEEHDFITLFPSFENALEQDTSSHTKPNQHSFLIDASQVQQLVNIHCSLLSASRRPLDSPSDAHTIFENVRKLTLQSLLESQMASLSDPLDTESLVFQFSILRERLSGLHNTHKSAANRPYNFYVDAHVLEVSKAAVLIEELKTRLDVLIQEWPDQMVLQYLKTRCDDVLNLNLHSPVAKVLAALEQLLMQTEDWEIYANRQNTLKVHQQALTILIVDWRRLELSSWQALLQSQATSFADGASEWWFRLYDATVRGPLDVVDQEERGGLETQADYLAKLIPLLDDFIRSSPLGQYHIRMQLLHSFERFVSHLAPGKSHRQRLALGRVQRVLHATFKYYGLYSTRISTHLSEQRMILEKEIRGFIKMASWKDVNVHALKASAQRTHHQLYKSIRKFREVMRQPITTKLQPELAGEEELKNLQSDTRNEHRLTSELASFPGGDATTDHLLDLNRTFKRFDLLITSPIGSFIKSRSAYAVDNLAVDIISTTKALAALSIPTNTPAERREKQQKAMLVRKRKALSDLLKELKRCGLSVNIKPDVLSQQMDPLWIRDQPTMPEVTKLSISLQKCENYMNRLHGSLPSLRTSLSGHHSDLTTRELQRGMMFLESGYTMALDAQSCLAGALDSYQKLEHMSRRLKLLSSTPKIIIANLGLLERVSCIKDTLCKLTNAFDEIENGLEVFHDLQPSRTAPASVIQQAQSMSRSTRVLRDQVEAVVDDVKLTSFPILLENEHALVLSACQHITLASSSLRQWSQDAPHLRYILYPVHVWLNGQKIPEFPPSERESTATTQDSTDSAINVFLVNIQVLLAKCSNKIENDSSSERDGFLREDHRLLRDFTRLLNLEVILEHMDKALRDLAAYPEGDLHRNLQRFLPFLDRYMELVEEQLTAHTQWMKALLKLDYVLCSVMHTLATQGFCKPAETDESGSGGETSEAVGGVGLGEGSGAENVSKEIEDESQVEGLQGDEEGGDPNEDADDDNAIEMAENFDGDMEDVPDVESDEGNESDQENQPDAEEQLGELDVTDPSAVDEKLWGDDEGLQEEGKADRKTNEDHSQRKGGDSEVVAKEGKPPAKQDPKDKETLDEERVASADDEREEQAADDEGEEHPDASGAPLDDFVQDANTLDLPDDIDLGFGEKEGDMEGDKNDDMKDEDEDVIEDHGQPETSDEQQDFPESPHEVLEPMIDEDEGHAGPTQEMEDNNGDAEEDKHDDHTVAHPDVSAGEGLSAPGENDNADKGESTSSGQTGAHEGVAGHDTVAEKQANGQEGLPNASQSQVEPQLENNQVADSAATGSQQGFAPSRPENRLLSNPLRSLGDALKEIQQRFDDILNSEEPAEYGRQSPGEPMDVSQVEYTRPDEAEHDMQALGPAGEEQVAKLNEMKIADDLQTNEALAAMDVDVPLEVEKHERPPKSSSLAADPTTHGVRNDVEGAITEADRRDHGDLDRSAVAPDISAPKAKADLEDADEYVEAKLRKWKAEGLPDNGAEHIWRLYESLTHDLAYALCEQLRLILEPTLATRLKGDYRTGKRLNMKKIIPYIASDYTKDKIWMRRTRPSQREYQVLIAIDDSRSMAESHSIHLAYETLALVSKALSRLEAGDIAIAKFGETVDILHGFDEGPFTDQAGTKVMNAFRFDQKATNVLSLIDTSLKVLDHARERRSASSSSAADLWQLEIIISDGICQDHDLLRTIMRKAEEQRVMIVFVIVDSLHSSTITTAPTTANPIQNSILSMNQVAYKNVDGRMELQMERYLDSFPFEYYVVLRNVEALPEVLSGTLKQFFERISEE